MRAWEQFLEILESDFGVETVDKWLRSLKVIKFDAANIYIEAQNSFQISWFQEHVKHKASQVLRTGKDRPFKIHMELLYHRVEDQKEIKASSPTLLFNPDILNKNYTFENFIFSEENALTLQCIKDLIGHDQSPPSLGFYNPIFLYGEKGSGKTHLLTSIALGLQKQKIPALYVKAETFTEHLIKAMRQGQMNTFRNTYRNVEVLIVDNVEEFSNKSATQEEFFHTFNHYHTQGKQIVLSSHLPTKKLEKIEPRLISRFDWGLTLSLASLSKDKLPLFLLKKLQVLDLSLTKESSSFLLGNCTSLPLLSKALETLSYKYHLHKKEPISLAIAKDLVSPLLEEVNLPKLSPEKILTLVAGHFDLNKEDLIGKAQTRDIVFPRQIAMYFLRTKLSLSYLKIGKIFSKDHSTIISSVDQIVKNLEKKESKTLSPIESLEKQLN